MMYILIPKASVYARHSRLKSRYISGGIWISYAYMKPGIYMSISLIYAAFVSLECPSCHVTSYRHATLPMVRQTTAT